MKSTVDPLAHPVCSTWPHRLTAVRAWHAHIPFAMFLVDCLRPRTLVELGVHAGDSYCAFCQAVAALGLDTRCYGVDTWRGDPHAGAYDGARILADLRAHHDPRYGRFSTLLCATFDEAREGIGDGTVDLLHIDGCHTYEAVKRDFESWLPKLSPRGVVLLHDTAVHERDFGIRAFWEECRRRYPHFEFRHGHGLGLLAAGAIDSPELKALVESTPDETAAIRSVFHRLGSRLSPADRGDAPPDWARSSADSGVSAAHRLQLFWDDGGFSEGSSVSTPLSVDGAIHHHVLWLPGTARGPLRLDPGEGPASVEIHGLELHAYDDRDPGGAEVLCRWSPAGTDARLSPIRGIIQLAGDGPYRLLCTDDDPQLRLDGVPARADARPRALRVTLSVSGRVLDVATGEIARLGQALAEQRLVFETARAEWRSEGARLADRVAEQDDALQALHAETDRLAHALSAVAADLDGQRRALSDSQRQLEERESLLRRIADSRGWRVLNTYRSLKEAVLAPVRRAARTWSTRVRGQCRPRLWPIQDVRAVGEAGAWQSLGRDPQLRLAPPWPRGWAEITLDVEVAGAVSGQARLYLDRGRGYSERESYDLGAPGGRQRRVVWLPPEVIALRFDPFESAGWFRVRSLALRPVPEHVARKAGGIRFEPAEAAPSSPPPAAAVFVVPPALDPYEAWLEVNGWNGRRRARLEARLSALAEPPRLSVVMPVYDPAPEFLDRAIASVAGQVYPQWELCVADDGSTDPVVRETLSRWAEREPRVRVVTRAANGGISRATNDAAALARGDFLVFLDHDDELTDDALGEVALHLAEYPETDVVYSDDDKIDPQGRRFAPQFKPDWSPELLLSYMYWSHLLVVRRDLFAEVGGLRAGYEGAQDYDLALRLTERTERVGHVPKVLYHWRALPGSTAVSGAAKPESFRAGVRALQDALDRRGVRAVAHQPEWARRAACGIFAHQFPDWGPSVAVIVPTRNNLPVLKACLRSLEPTTYKNYQVVVVDNGSDDPATLEFLASTAHRVLRLPSPGGRFNFAALNNQVVEQTDAEYVLFLNDDTEVVAPGWLSQMVGYLGLPGVGAVGARLRFPDGRLQHAGIVHGYYGGLAGPAFKLLPASGHGYLAYTMVARNYGAVTAACLLTRRELFRQLGGFDAETFAVAYNDVDYCYRLRAAGHRVVYCPTAELIHHEGASRGFADDPAEPAAFRKKYAGWRDPYYNPNLSLRHERFAVDARTLTPPQTAPIRALMCAFTLNWEGSAYSQLELTIGLKARGVIEPIVYCPQGGPLREAYEAAGIRVEVFDSPLRRARDGAAYEAAIEEFAEWIRSLGVEVVYGNTRQTFYAIDAAKRLDLPSVWNQRESEPWPTYFDYLNPELVPRALGCFAYPYRVVFVADATRKSCGALDAHHSFVTIHTGLDRERFVAALEAWPRARAREDLGIAPDDVLVLLVGTVCERKGQIDLVDALGRMDERAASHLKVFVVGDRAGEYSERLERARHALPADRRARVEIVAETPDTGRYYASADVFACTSRVESFPRVILEAMAAGLPIVTTPVYGIAEQVREHVNALCYKPGDVDALARHLERLQREPQLRQRLAGNSRHVLDVLNDFDSMVAAYADVFREAWASGASR